MRLKKQSPRRPSVPTPKEARAAAQITQRELAKRVPTTQKTVNLAEQTGRYPRQLALRQAYLKALGLPADVAGSLP